MRRWNYDYAGTRWTRKADGATITIVGDAEPAAGSTRSVRARNEATGRHFWVTPEGIHRKYWQGVENDCPNAPEGTQR